MNIKSPKQNFCKINYVTNTRSHVYGTSIATLDMVFKQFSCQSKEQQGANKVKKLMALDVEGKKHRANVMVYISPCINIFYLSRYAYIKLGIINSEFSRIGASMESCSVHEYIKTCRCIPRTPTIEPMIQKIPFKPIVCDYFITKYGIIL